MYYVIKHLQYSLDRNCARLNVIIVFITFLRYTTPLSCQISECVTWFGRILTVLKIFTVYSSLVANFLIFVVKFFSHLPSIYDGESRQKHQFYEFFVAVCKNDNRTKTHQYSLTAGNIDVFLSIKNQYHI